MVSQAYKASAQQVQPKLCPSHIKVVLSVEVHAALKLDHHEKSQQFKKNLDHAWRSLDNVMKTITSKYNKSVKHVQNELYLGHTEFHSRHNKINPWNSNKNIIGGKPTLHNLVQQIHEEYLKLSVKEKEHIIEEFCEFCECRTMVIQVTTKSKISDITYTVNTVENELHNLRSRTGAKAILFLTCRSADLLLQTIAFMTEGVANFMGSVMGIDVQTFITKMEGFAMQGYQGAAQNHQACVSSLHQKEITSYPTAKMQWAQYHQSVICCYQVAIDGWPEDIPFANLSDVSSSLSQLELLLQRWKSGVIHWKMLSDEEVKELQEKRDRQMENGQIKAHTHCTCSDKGKKHKHHSLDSNNNEAENPHKGPAIPTDNNPTSSTSATPTTTDTS
ncbi:hypothetical protein V8B97DRAFT_2022613 [Scleroderma yunnanense]